MKKVNTQIRFECEGNQVDANTLINELITYTSLINEVNKQYSNGSKDINIKVNAFEKGSFIVDIELVENLYNLFASRENVQYLAAIVTIIGGLFSLFKKYKGSPTPKNSIQINKNITINETITNIYNSPLTRKPISCMIESASNDPSVEGLQIKSKVGEKDFDDIKIEKDEFKELIYKDFESELEIPEERHSIIENAHLTITKLAFEPGSRWEFIYSGFPISMTVKDANLMSLINHGQKFAKGDALLVDLDILSIYDLNLNAYINKSYKIIEFKKLIEAPIQGEIPIK